MFGTFERFVFVMRCRKCYDTLRACSIPNCFYSFKHCLSFKRYFVFVSYSAELFKFKIRILRGYDERTFSATEVYIGTINTLILQIVTRYTFIRAQDIFGRLSAFFHKRYTFRYLLFASIRWEHFCSFQSSLCS